MLVDYIFNELKSEDYYKLFMLDLPKILESQKIDIHEFFRQPIAGENMGCNIRVPLNGDDMINKLSEPKSMPLCNDDLKTLHETI